MFASTNAPMKVFVGFVEGSIVFDWNLASKAIDV